MSHSRPTEASAETTPGNFNPTLWWLTIAGICTIIILGSVFVTLSYRKLSVQQAQNPHPNYIGKLETDLEAVNRDGKEVALGQLRDKIYVVGYQYTNCPSGCLGMAGVMKQLHERFGARDDFHLVSVSLDPASDTPEAMDQWVKDHGVDVENWWFLTGDPERIRKYMNKYFMFFEMEENTDAAKIASEGKFAHDQRLVIVDGKANIRGYYGVMNLELGESEIKRLMKDLDFLFQEKE